MTRLNRLTAAQITTIRVNLGIEERACETCRWLTRRGNLCQEPEFVARERGTTCYFISDHHDNAKQFPKWEARDGP